MRLGAAWLVVVLGPIVVGCLDHCPDECYRLNAVTAYAVYRDPWDPNKGRYGVNVTGFDVDYADARGLLASKPGWVARIEPEPLAEWIAPEGSWTVQFENALAEPRGFQSRDGADRAAFDHYQEKEAEYRGLIQGFQAATGYGTTAPVRWKAVVAEV